MAAHLPINDAVGEVDIQQGRARIGEAIDVMTLNVNRLMEYERSTAQGNQFSQRTQGSESEVRAFRTNINICRTILMILVLVVVLPITWVFWLVNSCTHFGVGAVMKTKNCSETAKM